MTDGSPSSVRRAGASAALPYVVSICIILLIGLRAIASCADCALGLPTPVLGAGSIAWAVVGYLWLSNRTSIAAAASIGLTILHSILVLSTSVHACLPCIIILAIETLFVVSAWLGSSGRAPAAARVVVRSGAFIASALTVVSVASFAYGQLTLSNRATVRLTHVIPKDRLPAFLLIVKKDCGACPRNFADLEKTVHSRIHGLQTFSVVNVEEASGRELALALGIRNLPAFVIVAKDYTTTLQQGTTLADFLDHGAGRNHSDPSPGVSKGGGIRTESPRGKVLGKDRNQRPAAAILAGAGTSEELADLVLLGESPLTRWAALRACRGRSTDLKVRRVVRIAAAHEDDPWIRALASDLSKSFPAEAGN